MVDQARTQAGEVKPQGLGRLLDLHGDTVTHPGPQFGQAIGQPRRLALGIGVGVTPAGRCPEQGSRPVGRETSLELAEQIAIFFRSHAPAPLPKALLFAAR